jgi:hypothetical protein
MIDMSDSKCYCRQSLDKNLCCAILDDYLPKASKTHHKSELDDLPTLLMFASGSLRVVMCSAQDPAFARTRCFS